MGERIRIERERAGLTQGQLGELVGVKQQSVAKWENGGNVSARRLEQVATALALPVAHLLGPINEVRVPRTTEPLVAVEEHIAGLHQALDDLRNLTRSLDRPDPADHDIEQVMDRLRSARSELDWMTEEFLTFLRRAQADGNLAAVDAAQSLVDELPRLSHHLTATIAEALELLYEQRAELERRVSGRPSGQVSDASETRLAAHGADAEQQTVEHRQRPGADAPEEQETP